MRPLGTTRKISTKIEGHQECAVCHPDFDVCCTREKSIIKKEIKEQMESEKVERRKATKYDMIMLGVMYLMRADEDILITEEEFVEFENWMSENTIESLTVDEVRENYMRIQKL